jgi:protein gp37
MSLPWVLSCCRLDRPFLTGLSAAVRVAQALRLMDPQWARDLLRNCQAKKVAFFMKQMTGKKPIPSDLRVRQFPHA